MEIENMEIREDDLSGAETRGLIARHLADMRETSPEESCHALDADALQDPSVTFWSAWIDGRVAGIGALKRLDAVNGEVKSMRVEDAFRGSGVGRALVRHILTTARRHGLRAVWLETGAQPAFAAARGLYASEGFVECGPFASYREDPHSVFMRLDL
jgi:putative acetyltransferase